MIASKHLVQVFLDNQAMDHLEDLRVWWSKQQGREASTSEVMSGLIMAHWKRSITKRAERRHDFKVARKLSA